MRHLTLFALLLVACGGEPAPDLTDEVAAPSLGKADGADRADRGCQVVLRTLARPPGPNGGWDGDGRWWYWDGALDVAEAALGRNARPAVMYQGAAGQPWRQVAAVEEGAGAPGMRRFRFRLVEDTAPAPFMSGTSLARSRMQVAPLLVEEWGGRVFDHNRVPGDLDNYVLDRANDWVIADDPAVCAGSRARAELDFRADWSVVQRGAIVPGGKLTIRYALERLPQCRNSRAGYQLWDIDAHVRFSGGQEQKGSVTRVAMGARQPAPLEVDVPQGATSVELWFHNYSAPYGCDAWDSAYGQNHRFPVVPRPAAVGWAGDWGNGLWRGCTRRDGLDEPVVIDSYIRERACKFVTADVYVPGLTDGAALAPAHVLAEVEVSLDGGPATRAPLAFEGRAGNNYRYRWELPYELAIGGLAREARFSFHFSTDGETWTTLGPRTAVRTY